MIRSGEPRGRLSRADRWEIGGDDCPQRRAQDPVGSRRPHPTTHFQHEEDESMTSLLYAAVTATLGSIEVAEPPTLTERKV